MSESEQVETTETVVEEKPSWWTRSTSWVSRYPQFMWGAAVGVVAGIAVGGWSACVFRSRK